MTLINNRDLEIIQTILKDGSFTQASGTLFMSQPALSQAVKRIEEKIGQIIFNRDESPIVLTPAGRVYYNALLDIKVIQERMAIELGQVGQGIRTEFRIGTTKSRLTYWMPLLIDEFQAIYPMVKLTLIEASALELIDQVIHSNLSFALIPELNEYATLEFTPLYEEEIILAGVDSGTYSFSSRQYIRFEELDGLPMIALPQGHHVRRVQEQIFAQHHIDLNIIRETKSDITAFRFASEGEGFVFCADIIPRYILPIYNTSLWSISENGLYRKIGVLTKKGKEFSTIERQFCSRYQALAQGQISSYGSDIALNYFD